MSKYEIYVSERAQKDLQKIVDYLSLQLLEPSISKNIMAKIDTAILGLQDMPQRYSLVSDKSIKKAGIRKLVVKNYIVFFKIYEEKKRVGIVRILYGRRNWQKMI